MQSAPLPYTDETILSPDGLPCRVLDVARVDFSIASLGRKSAETLVRCALGGEIIVTCDSSGHIESEYVTSAGDAIFINLHDINNIYVPGDADGKRWQYCDLAAHGYDILREDFENGGVRVKNATAFRILHEVVLEPTCIKDAHGPGKHQFVYEGATLKLNQNGSISSIDKEAFGSTWEITQPPMPTGQVLAFRPRTTRGK